jgi:hypothetical protein
MVAMKALVSKQACTGRNPNIKRLKWFGGLDLSKITALPSAQDVDKKIRI